MLDDVGEAWCWGVTSAPPVHVGGSYTEISANCGLLSSGRVECWAETSACIPAGPVLKADGTPLTGVTVMAQTSARAFRTCGISGGQLWCWGQEGMTCSPRASQVAGVPAMDSVSVSEDDTCALSGADAWCWGPHLGATGFPSPTRLRGNTSAVAVGGEHQLFHTTIACDPPWTTSVCGIGQNADGQVQAPSPPTVPTYLTSFTHTNVTLPLGDLVAGSRHSCSLDPTAGANVVTCFGSTVALGGVLAQSAVGTITDLVAGEDYTCMIDDGVVACWGSNAQLQLGTGPGPDRYVAAPIIW